MGFNGMLLVGFLTFAVLVIWGVATWTRAEKRDEERRRDHLAHADDVVTGLFDGSPAVTYVSVDTKGGLSTEALVAAANSHHYRLSSETGQGLARRVVFEKISG